MSSAPVKEYSDNTEEQQDRPRWFGNEDGYRIEGQGINSVPLAKALPSALLSV